ncbi:hypothetical protein AHF37_12235 [Paragonimus kellicotti]|nr:hypothetical protein AHF37_12235 [Paragonimus kellicotti]
MPSRKVLSHVLVLKMRRNIACSSMNPYSFKRFLQNPERPRHPVQLVRSDANNILVHGELPDCVQGPNSTLQQSVIPDLNPVLSQLAESVSANPSQPAAPTSRFANTIPSPSSSSELNTTYSDGLTASSGRPTPPPVSLPDIHPSNTAEESSHRTPSPVYSTRTLDILHGGLPDFLLNRFSETVTSNYRQSLRTTCILEDRGKRVTRVASLPPTSKENALRSSRILSRSHDRLLLNGGQVDCFPNNVHQALLNSASAADALEPRGSVLLSNLKVDLCQPPAAQCIACGGTKSQVVAEQQQQIHKVSSKVSSGLVHTRQANSIWSSHIGLTDRWTTFAVVHQLFKTRFKFTQAYKAVLHDHFISLQCLDKLY